MFSLAPSSLSHAPLFSGFSFVLVHRRRVRPLCFSPVHISHRLLLIFFVFFLDSGFISFYFLIERIEDFLYIYIQAKSVTFLTQQNSVCGVPHLLLPIPIAAALLRAAPASAAEFSLALNDAGAEQSAWEAAASLAGVAWDPTGKPRVLTWCDGVENVTLWDFGEPSAQTTLPFVEPYPKHACWDAAGGRIAVACAAASCSPGAAASTRVGGGGGCGGTCVLVYAPPYTKQPWLITGDTKYVNVSFHPTCRNLLLVCRSGRDLAIYGGVAEPARVGQQVEDRHHAAAGRRGARCGARRCGGGAAEVGESVADREPASADHGRRRCTRAGRSTHPPNEKRS